ncbi:MAG: hypothetical protein A3G18_03065 [Rhodospirillales bacterium RIFCSPLOWO2_12_FULL_58_28]|nr:MAG: hypothetical protein A3H92_06490 [Rhodospirillales bacterium RIFCSPLOWO2_02_FULL_58_16]OHC77207.1 MAG: hypothetical protein A3G18_03065 [Rhodospirillales bacterium RIFCSPLOWO2_12_FULL_58_28]
MYKKDLVKNYEAPPPEGNPRKVEAWALTQAALKMRAAKETGDHEQMQTAIRLNWRLWTIFQAELLSPECTAPDDIRSNVLSLSNFVDKHTLDFISNPLPEKLDILISINRELAGGLYTDPKQAGEGDGEPAKDTSPLPAGETSA